MSLVELDRRFVPYREGADEEMDVPHAFLGAPTFSWADILGMRCVVVLGEAGTGKTTEFGAQASQLRESGAFGLFLRVEDVAAVGMRDVLLPAEAAELDKWASSSEGAVGHFFLDAVDESKLKGDRLETALLRVAQELGDKLRRARIVLSCRLSDWTSTEATAVKRLVSGWEPGPVSKEDMAQQGGVVQLLPLDEAQVRLLVAHLNVEDIDGFIDSVRGAGAWQLVERPLDVKWLVEYWLEHESLGTWRELIDHNIKKKLMDRADRRGQLPPERAREGAAALAAVGVLTQRGGILVPDDNASMQFHGAFDPRDVLEDWSVEEIRQLLGLGLFDEATYGRVRIHHRSVREFLAAEQLGKLLTSGAGTTDLIAVLFQRVDGTEIIPRHLASVATWLAPSSEPIYRRLISTAPEHLIDEGDPASLSPESRCEVLRAYAKKFGDRKLVFHHFDYMGLRRFATPELEASVSEMLMNCDSPTHLRRTLLELVEVGGLRGCMEAVAATVFDGSAPIALRNAALDAYGNVASDAEMAETVEQLDSTLLQQRETAFAVLNMAFPKGIDVARVATILRSVDPPTVGRYSRLDAFVFDELPRRMSRAQQRDLLARLIADPYIGEAPGGLTDTSPAKPPGLRAHLWWLGKLVTVLLSEALTHDPVFDRFLAEALELLPRIARENNLRSSDLDTLLEGSSEVHSVAFWHYCGRARAGAAGKVPRTCNDCSLPYQYYPNSNDAGWLARDSAERAATAERLLAFNTLLRALTDGGVRADDDPRVQDLVARESTLAKHFERWKRRRDQWQPAAETRKHERRRKAFHLREEREKAEERAFLRSVLPQIREGANLRALMHLYQVGIANHPEEAFSRAAVEREYDTEIAEAAEVGLRRFWRETPVEHIHEYESHKVPWAGILALAGIELEVAGGLVVHELEPRLLRVAIANAAWKLNGFPGWMSEVAAQKPEAVREAYQLCLEADFDEPDPSDGQTRSPGRLMCKVEGADEAIRRACAPILFTKLAHSDPPCAEMLRRVLGILSSVDWAHHDVAILGGERTTQAVADSFRFAVWWTEWLHVAPVPAIAHLEQTLAERLASEGDSLVVEIANTLWERGEFRRRSEQRLLIDVDVTLLERFTRIVFRHVRKDEDVIRVDGYSPGPRDHAQELRDSLLGRFASAGRDGLETLLRFSRDPMFARNRDYIVRLVEEQRVVVAPRSVANAVRLACHHICTPCSSRELFAVVRGRLCEIGEGIENGTFSPRRRYQGRPPEEDFQILLAGELQRRQAGQFTVCREAETARRDKPDIWVTSPRAEGPVTIEVKVAERWSGPELVAFLHEQLVGRYMRDRCAAHGIYALCSAGEHRRWRPKGQGNLNFDALVAHLQTVADDIVSSGGDIEAIDVVGIDFH